MKKVAAKKDVVGKKDVAPKKDAVKMVEFSILASEGSKVSVAGSFNNWDLEKNPLKAAAGRGLFAASIVLAPGRYEYKFVVNGIWMTDPECKEWVANGCGSQNSVVTVSA